MTSTTPQGETNPQRSHGAAASLPAGSDFAIELSKINKSFGPVQANRDIDLQGYLSTWRARARPPGSVRVIIDVDPYSFL